MHQQKPEDGNVADDVSVVADSIVVDIELDRLTVASSPSKDDNDNGGDVGTNCVHKVQELVVRFVTDYKKYIVGIICLLLLAGYTVYFIFAIMYNLEWAIALIVFTCLAVLWIAYTLLRDNFGDVIEEKIFKPIGAVIERVWPVAKWFFYPAVIITVVLYLSLDVIKEGKQLQSVSGFIACILVMFFTSKHPDKVVWRPVLWGFILQFVFAILVLRWKYGYIAIKFISDEIIKFILYGFEGAATVFGDPWLLFHPFAFMGVPLLIYLGGVMGLLYYFGITQRAASSIGWLMQITLGTTAIETLNVAANIFLDGMDTMLMLRPYLDQLTLSEFNCLLVGNHATVAGFIFALFVLFGAPPQHLLSAAIMSAPATIAICKLNYPETEPEKSKTKKLSDLRLTRGDEVNLFEATYNGAAIAAKTAAAVVASYIAFISLLAFVNSTLSWLGGRVGFPELSFELLCSYVMWPIALIIGVEIDECQESAKLIGLKIFATEVLAYQELGKSAAAGLLNQRSQALTTYAMCGFSSLSTLAIAVGIWTTICPQRVKLMAQSMFRVLVEANVSCFMTACVAGLFYSEDLMEFFENDPAPPAADFVTWLLGVIPGYKQLMALGGF